MSKKIIEKVLIVLCVLLVFLVIFFLNSNNLIDEQILSIRNLYFETKTYGTVADFMNQLQTESKINFKSKNYSGMGIFIEEINGIKNGGKNWIYYVNDKKANIGISNYQLKPGDVVSWKYESSY